MAKLGNLWFDLGLSTEDMDKAWKQAIKRYDDAAKIDIRVTDKGFRDALASLQKLEMGEQSRAIKDENRATKKILDEQRIIQSKERTFKLITDNEGRIEKVESDRNQRRFIQEEQRRRAITQTENVVIAAIKREERADEQMFQLKQKRRRIQIQEDTSVIGQINAEEKLNNTLEQRNNIKKRGVVLDKDSENKSKMKELIEKRTTTEAEKAVFTKKKGNTEDEKAILLKRRQEELSQRMRLALERHNAALEHGNKQLGTQSRLMQNLHTLAASYVSVFAAGRLVRELITVSGEFEMQRVSLQAILKDLDGANKIFDQIKELAVKSPFQFKDLISYTKQLSAFSIPMNELYDTTKMLSDVSAGLGVGMDRLVLAYGQIRAASVLRGQEIRQLTEAGIPVIEELRKKFEALGETGITAADVFDKVSARLVPFSMIKEMFEDMTSAGGKFYKMQEIQAETLKGKVSNLKDAYQIMFAEIGEKGDKVLKGAVDLTRSAIDNYETIGKIIGNLIVIYGTYKGTLMAVNAAIAVNTAYQRMNAAAVLYSAATHNSLNVAQLAILRVQKAINASMLANPYTWIAVAVAGLAVGIYNAATASSTLDAAQERLNKTLERSNEVKKGAISGAEGLTSVIRDGTKDIYDQVTAFNELIRKYEFFQKYSIEDIQKMSAAEFASVMSQFGVYTDKASAQKNYNDQVKTIQTIKDKIAQAQKELSMATDKETNGIVRRIEALKKQQKAEEIMLGVYQKRIDKIAEQQEMARIKGMSVGEQITYYNSQISALKKIQDDIERISPESRTADQILQLSEANDKIVSFKASLSSLGGELATWEKNLNKYASSVSRFGEVITRKGDESTEDFLARLRDDYENTTKLIASRSQLAGQDVTQLKERLSVLSGAFKAIGISPIEAKEGKVKPEKEQKDYRGDLIELEKKLALDLAKARIDGMSEGFDKEMAQMDYEHQKRLAAIDKQKQDLLEAQKKAGGSGTVLTPTNAAVIGGLSQEATKQYNTSEAALYKSVLDKYRSFEQRRLDIAAFYVAEEKRIKAASYGKTFEEYEAYISQMKKARAKDLKDLDDEVLNATLSSSSFLQRVFSDIGSMTKQQLRQNIADAKQLLKYITKAEGATLPTGVKPEDVEKMVGDYKAISKLQKIIAESQNKNLDLGNTPLGGFIEGFSLLKLAAKESQVAVDNAGTQIGADAKVAAEQFKGMAAGAIIGAAGQLADMLGGVADRMNEVAEATGNQKMKEFADQMKDVSGFFSDAAKGFKEGGWIGAAIAAVFSAATKTIDAFQQAKLQDAIYKKDQMDWAREYQDMMLRLSNNDYESIFGVRVLEKSIDAYKNAVKALRNYDDELNKRTAPTIEKERKATGIATFFGFGGGMNATVTKDSQLALDAYKKGYSDIQRMAVKTKDQSGWANFWGAKDEFKTLFDIAPEIWGKELGGEFNVNAAKVFLETNTQITEEQRKQIQNLITQKELYDENVNIIKEDLKDTFGGMGDAMVDSIVRAMTEGADSWELFKDAGESAIEKLGEKLMYELFFAKRFEKYGEDLMAVYDDETLTPEEIANKQIEITDRYMDFFKQDQEAAEKWAEMYRNSARSRGYDVWTEDGEGGSLGKGIQSLSETTGNLVASYLNSVRSDTAIIRDTIKGNAPILGNINEQMGVSLAHLSAIANNTLRGAVASERVANKLDSLTTRGGATKMNVSATL